MELNGQSKLLTIYTGELEKYNHRLLYEAIVYAAKKSGMAGATVTKGIMSFGANSKVHTTKIFALSTDLPVKIEIIDNEDMVSRFIKVVEKMFDKSNSAGLITLTDTNVIAYMSNKKKLL